MISCSVHLCAYFFLSTFYMLFDRLRFIYVSHKNANSCGFRLRFNMRNWSRCVYTPSTGRHTHTHVKYCNLFDSISNLMFIFLLCISFGQIGDEFTKKHSMFLQFLWGAFDSIISIGNNNSLMQHSWILLSFFGRQTMFLHRLYRLT